MGGKDGVECAVFPGIEVNLVGGKNSERPDSRPAHDILRQPERARGRKREGAIEQYRIDARFRLDPNAFNARLFDSIPVLQCGLEIALKEVDGCQEVRGIRIARIQAQRAPEPSGRFGVALLFEGNAAKLDQKAFVVGLEPVSGE